MGASGNIEWTNTPHGIPEGYIQAMIEGKQDC